jgi:hypothetical protein
LHHNPVGHVEFVLQEVIVEKEGLPGKMLLRYYVGGPSLMEVLAK